MSIIVNNTDHKFGKPTSELSTRQREVLMLVREGYMNKEVALKLGVVEADRKEYTNQQFP